MLEFLYPYRECPEEGLFFFGYDPLDQGELACEFGKIGSHLFFKHRDKPEDEGIAHAKEGVCIPYGTAEDATDHIACFHIGG